jgi:hypothetical protein
MPSSELAMRGLATPHDFAHPIVHVEKSNLAPEKKSQIRAYWEGLHGRLDSLAREQVKPSVAEQMATQTFDLVRQDAVAALTGLGIAWFEHKLGGNLDLKGIPMDGVVAAAAGAAALATPYLGIDVLSPEFRTISSTAAGILLYRKGREHYGTTSGASAHGDGSGSLAELASEL